MDHCLVTYTSGLETCLFFHALQPGTYEVLCYAWMPNHPTVLSYTNSDEEPGNPHRIVGGAGPGQQLEPITYAAHYCNVTSASGGLLRIHSGIVPGHNPADGAACNGIQLRKLPQTSAADMNCDGAKNGADVEGFV